MPPSTTELHPPVQAFIGLGANLGDAHGTLQAALTALAALPNTVLRRSSPVYRSVPLDASGPDFFNAVAWLDTQLAPQALLAELQRIEQAHGRERPYRNAPRTLDLDLLLYGQQRIDSATLTVPHPRLHERAFVVRPLADIAPDLGVPGLGRAQDLLARVAGQQADKLPS
jgi:2-amino-4-hydroxy-6-hydroxymethyldihydropteridine diphosphokinase